MLSPAQITSSVLSTSTSTSPSANSSTGLDFRFQLLREDTLPSHPGLQDGFWEVSDLLRKREKEIASLRQDLGERSGAGSESEIVAFEAAYDAIDAMVEGLEGGVKGVRSMDYWVGVFERV